MRSIFATYLATLLLIQSINVVLLCKVYKHLHNFQLTSHMLTQTMALWQTSK